MALTGVIHRRDNKSAIIQNPPRVGEIVYSLDTEEYGSLQNGTLIWKKFDDIVKSVAGRTGNVVLNKFDVELGNVDNTSDLDKPINNATQAALSAHEATVNAHNVTTELLGLDNVDNTSDMAKPVSTAQQTAINNAVSSITEVDNALHLDGKAASEYALVVDYFTKIQTQDKLNTKADKASVYTKTEDDALLAVKANQTDLNDTNGRVHTLESTIVQKADKTYVDSQDTILSNKINTKADQSIVDTLSDKVTTNISDIATNKTNITNNKNDITVLEAQKANKSYVDSQDTALSDRIDTNITNITNLSNTKADKTYVDSQDTALSDRINTLDTKKADITYVDSQINSSQSDTSDSLALKADKTYVDSQDTALQNSKADKTYVDSKDTALQNSKAKIQKLIKLM